jgi:hypothetical protein
MKASLITNISSKGLTQIGRPVQKFQSFEKKKCFFSTVWRFVEIVEEPFERAEGRRLTIPELDQENLATNN